MNITVIGAGNVGSAVASGAVKAGHIVTVTARDDAAVQAAATKTGAQVSTDIPAAVAAADVIVLAVPYAAVADVAARIAERVRGKVVIDATNSLTPDYSGLAVSERSGAEEIQDLLAGAHVVKAFNTVFAANRPPAGSTTPSSTGSTPATTRRRRRPSPSCSPASVPPG